MVLKSNNINLVNDIVFCMSNSSHILTNVENVNVILTVSKEYETIFHIILPYLISPHYPSKC